MRSASAPRAALAAALLVLVTFAAGPAEADEVRVLAEGGVEGPGWIAVTLLLNDGRAWVRAVGGISSDHHAQGTAQLDADGTLLSASLAWDEPIAHASVGSNATAPTAEPVSSSADAPSTTAGARASTTVNRVGTTIVVLWMAGDFTVWSWEVVGESGAAVVGLTQGADAFLHGARDFETPAHARVVASDATARANVASSLTIGAQATFIGLFHAADGLTETTRLTTPAGERTGCPCWLSATDAGGSAGGRYTFHLDGVRAGRTTDVLVTGADVVLPPT